MRRRPAVLALILVGIAACAGPNVRGAPRVAIGRGYVLSEGGRSARVVVEMVAADGYALVRDPPAPRVTAAAESAESQGNEAAREFDDEGLRLLGANRFADARERFYRALEEDPTFVLPALHLARVFALQRDWANVADALQRAIDRDPSCATCFNDLGEAQYYRAITPGLTRDPAASIGSARAAFTRALELSPRLWQAHLRLGQLAELVDDTQTAAREYTATLRAAPRAYSAYLRLARLYAARQLHDQSAQVLREGVRIAPPGAPERPLMHHALGTTLLALGQRADATREFAAALELDPEFNEAMFSLGMTCAELPGRRDDAERWLQRFVEHAQGGLWTERVSAARERLSTLRSPP